MEARPVFKKEYCVTISETEEIKTKLNVYEYEGIYYADLTVLLEQKETSVGEKLYFDFFFAPCFLSSETKQQSDGGNLLTHGRRLSLQFDNLVKGEFLVIEISKGYIGTKEQLECAVNYKLRVRKVRCSHCLYCKLLCLDLINECPDQFEPCKSCGNLLVNREFGELTGLLLADLRIEQINKREKDLCVTYVIMIRGIFNHNCQRNLEYRQTEQLPCDYPLCRNNCSISACIHTKQSINYEIIWGQ